MRVWGHRTHIQEHDIITTMVIPNIQQPSNISHLYTFNTSTIVTESLVIELQEDIGHTVSVVH